MLKPSELNSRALGFFTTSLVFLLLTLPAVCLRLWIRFRVLGSLGVDDVCLALSELAFISVCISNIFMALYGYGTHFHAVSMASAQESLKCLYVSTISLFVSLFFLKIAICIFLLRLTPIKWQRKLIWCVGSLNSFVYFAFFFEQLFQCWPIHWAWGLSMEVETHCVPDTVTEAFLYLQYSVSLITDVTLSTLPILLLRNSNMPTKAKVITCCLLCLGFAASSTTIVCIVYIPSSLNSSDFLYTSVPITLWSMAEAFAGIVAASFVAYRPFFKSLKEKITERSWTTKSGTFGSKKPLQSNTTALRVDETRTEKPKRPGSPIDDIDIMGAGSDEETLGGMSGEVMENPWQQDEGYRRARSRDSVV